MICSKKNLKYRVVINGDKTVAAQTSILLNDLGTYQGTIAEAAHRNVYSCLKQRNRM